MPQDERKANRATSALSNKQTMASVSPERRGGIRTALTTEQRDNIRALMGEQPKATDAQLAIQLGVSPSAVSKLRDRPTKGPDEALEEFGRRIAKRLSIKQRVEVVAEVARENKANPFVRLRAVELANEFQGMISRKQAKDSESAQVMPQPIFVLPAGAQLVSVQPVIYDPSQKRDDSK